VRIGILGGTGPAGSAVATRLAACGFDVVIGSRSAERAAGIAQELRDKWPARRLTLEGADNPTAARADVVVVGTPWDAAAPTAASVGAHLHGKVVISMANAVAKVGDHLEPLTLARGSVAAGVQAAVPQALVSATFHHVPARAFADLDHDLDADVLVCSDNDTAMSVTMDIVDKIPGLRALDAGPLANATPVETFTPVLLQLNRRYKTRTAPRFTGIGD
jgi:NADPH-dependent F420 reductase